MREASKGGRDTSEEDLVLQVKNIELVYKHCIVMRRNVLFDRFDGMILCDGNYGLGAYAMYLVHSRPSEPEQSRVTI